MVQPRGPRREHSSSSDPRNGGMTRPHRQNAACDRCRGQKLRCMWDPKEPQCQRCQRADAVCTIPQPRPMGRPPRNHRGSISNSRDVGLNDSTYPWDEDTRTPSVSSSEDPAMMLGYLAEPLDLLNYFRGQSALNDLCAPGGPTVATSTIPTSSTNFGDNNVPFSPLNDLFTSTLVDFSGDKQGLDSPRELAGEKSSPLEKRANDQVQLIIRLCELNVTLLQHPLHQEKDEIRSQKPLTPDSTNHSSAGKPTGNAPLPHLSVADLGVGKLFQATNQLQDIISALRSMKDGNSRKEEGNDRSTTLMALSCYTRLDTLYSRTLELLLQVRNGDRQFSDMEALMFDLVIDGFSTSARADSFVHPEWWESDSHSPLRADG